MFNFLKKFFDKKERGCKHKNTRMVKNVGSDVHEMGSEEQHLEICNDCDMERFVCDIYPFDRPHFVDKGPWHKTMPYITQHLH